MLRVVLDTNVVVSALIFRGTASRLHGHWRARRVRLLVSADMLAELARVLRYPKFKLTGDIVEVLLATEVLPYSDRVEPNPGPPACRDPDDDKFLWCGRDGRADVVVTGDPDLLVLAPSWSGVPIITLAEMLARLEA